MASAERPESPDREGSCFSRAARAIRRALSRICGDTSPSPPTNSCGSYPSRRDISKSLTVRRRSKQELGLKKKKHLVSHPEPEVTLRPLTLRSRTSGINIIYLNEKCLPLKPSRSCSMSKHAPITDQDSTDTEGSKEQVESRMMSVEAESESGGVSDALVTVEAVVTAENRSATNTLQTRPHLQMSSDPGSMKRDSNCLSRPHSVPSLSQTSSAENKTFPRSQSLPDMIKSSFEEFTPEIPVCGVPTRSDTSEDSIFSPPPSPKIDLGTVSKRLRPLKRCSEIYSASTASSSDYTNITGGFQYDTRKTKGYFTAGHARRQLRDDDDSDSDELDVKRARMDWMSRHDEDTTSVLRASSYRGGGYVPPTPSQAQDQNLLVPTRKDTDDGGPSFEDSSSTFSRPSCSQSTAPTVCGPPCPQDRPVVLQDSDMLKRSCEEFTPDISVDEDDETYRFQCSCPGLYQCSVTGLLFHMEGEGDVLYRTVPWDRRLLAQHHKRPAGPLFDIKCVQQSVCQLHLPHCEIRSTGGGGFLSVAHVTDEGIQFIVPHKITETHVVINITGFSAFGNVKDEDSPPDPVRALVLLFYRPPADPDPDPESLLNVLMLPVNIVLRDVLRTRKKLVGDEIYVETSSHCKLRPKQEYTLSTCPEDDSVLVQPTEAEFDCDNYDNYFPSFQVILEKIIKHIKLFLRDTKSSKSVWERRVCLSSTEVKRSCGPSALSLPPNDRLLDIRSSFIHGISGPVLKSLLDKLLEKTVLTDSERESADEVQNHRDKARFVVDTVRKKGEAASSEMMEFLCELDPFLCEHLGLI